MSLTSRYTHFVPDSTITEILNDSNTPQILLHYANIVNGSTPVHFTSHHDNQVNWTVATLTRMSQYMIPDFMKLFPPLEPTLSLQPDCHCSFINLPRPEIKIPIEILSPPKPNYAKYHYDATTSRVFVNSKHEMYMDNFDVSQLIRDVAAIKTDSPSGNITKGLLKTFHDSIKLRALSPIMSMFHSLLSYRCPCCTSLNGMKKLNHLCFQYSSIYAFLCDMVRPYMCVPFFVDRLGVQILPGFKVSSQYPLLFFEAIELMHTVGLGNLSDSLSGWCFYTWLDRARIGVFREMFNRRGSITMLKSRVVSTGTIFRFSQREFVIESITEQRSTDISPTFEECSFSDSQYIQDNCYKPIYDITTTLDDVKCRWLDVALNYFYGAVLYVTGPVSLALEQSGMGRPGSLNLQFGGTTDVYVEGRWITIDVEPVSPFVSRIKQLADRELAKTKVNGDSLEHGFFEAQTTNSAGNTKETLAGLRSEIIEQHDSPQEGRLLASMAGIRVIDAMRRFNTTFRDHTEFLNEVRRPTKAGMRYQQQRRPRVIQMTGTEAQLGGWLLLNVYEPTYKRLGYTSSGKNIGDIRDMQAVLEASGQNGINSSVDIIGMDASTQNTHVTLLGSAAIKAYNPERIGFPKMFFQSTHNGGDANSRVLPTRVTRDGQTIPKDDDVKYNLPQLAIIYSLHGMHGPTILYDGYFAPAVLTSQTVFRSGWYNTSSQHTMLGSLVLLSLEEDIRNGYKNPYDGAPERSLIAKHWHSIRIIGRVLGDDILLKAFGPPTLTPDELREVTAEVCAEFEHRMELLGFLCERAFSDVMCEFLKQKGFGGAPHMFPDRLVLYTSERGNQAMTNPTTMYRVCDALIIEFNSRSRNIFNTCVSRRVLQTVCSTFALRMTSSGHLVRRSYASRKPYSRVAKVSDGILSELHNHKTVFRIIDYNVLGDHIAMIFLPMLWATNHILGCPPPAIVSISGANIPAASPLTYPSAAITTFWLTATSRRKIDFDSSATAYKKSMSDISNLTAVPLDIIFSFSNAMELSPLSINLDKDYDIDTLRTFGFIVGIMSDSLFPTPSATRAKIKSPVVDDWSRYADSLLNPTRVRSSHHGSEILAESNVVVPYELRYAHRGTAKVRQSMYELPVTDLEYGENTMTTLTQLSESLKVKPGTSKLLRDAMLAGEVFVIPTTHPVTLPCPSFDAHGYGHIIPPNSLQSLLLTHLGLPVSSASYTSSFAKTILSDGKLPGSAEAYLSLYQETYKKGPSAVAYLKDAIGFSDSSMSALERLASNGLYGISGASFAYNPRGGFFFRFDQDNADRFGTSLSPSPTIRRLDIVHMMFTMLMYPTTMVSQNQWMMVRFGRSFSRLARR
ncbi:VP1 [Mycoreovirus 1]|uniref:RNA-directed RNA polymerase VP1 n=2 Tax=Cryphonectria parasitica mycoreovirus 1 (strain 9B21) TaxID=230407 RepID=RDRP_MYRV9|nr:VP1 [Mycoreovirus 1]Q7TDB6.1 RecName: Full=RNA-directed RNA polymerase VP1 [Cryphonectria parasitica mycoreovirus 1]AAP45577.1 VP1 [Cryphonectria parasitica mycoreovirus 1]BAS02068.1 VP1 protein [Cryphonectria parasitica mycoreovirus 1]